ncbi:MAG: helix-hairpin-helix domain-containing protein [Syntrophotaleaceae bacterium]
MVESCVNFVGVDLNTASWALLSFVSGLSEAVAKAIVRHRDAEGAFVQRKQPLKVPCSAPRRPLSRPPASCAIRQAEQPLDNTAVHPERYPLVERMAADLGVTLPELIARPALLDTRSSWSARRRRHRPADPADIMAELKSRAATARELRHRQFPREDVQENAKDLQEGMTSTALSPMSPPSAPSSTSACTRTAWVHISQLADRFVKDPNQVVKVGQQVQVRDVRGSAKQRIGLIPCAAGRWKKGRSRRRAKPKPRPEKRAAKPATDLAAALEKSGFRVKKGKKG